MQKFNICEVKGDGRECTYLVFQLKNVNYEHKAFPSTNFLFSIRVVSQGKITVTPGVALLYKIKNIFDEKKR